MRAGWALPRAGGVVLARDHARLTVVSHVRRYGSYLSGPSVKKGDLVIEYRGERVSHDEGERRGRLYVPFVVCRPAVFVRTVLST